MSRLCCSTIQLLTISGAVLFSYPLLGQSISSDENLSNSAKLFRNRVVENQLSRAKSLFGQNQFPSALNLLQQILDTSHSFVLQDGRYQSSHVLANQFLAQLPAEALKFYERQFGPIAERRFQQAKKLNSLDQYREIAYRYRHSAAGLKAQQHLAFRHFDRGRFHEAEIVLQRILDRQNLNATVQLQVLARLVVCFQQSGDRQQLDNLLRTVSKPLLNQKFSFGGNSFDLKSWSAEIGSNLKSVSNEEPQENIAAKSVDAFPILQAKWTHQTGPLGGVGQLLQSSVSDLSTHQVVSIPALIPLSVDGFVCIRTYDRLIVFNEQTGSIRWQISTLPEENSQESDSRFLQNEQFRSRLGSSLIRKLQLDTISGSLSSDGVNLFAVMDVQKKQDAEKTGKQSNKSSTATTENLGHKIVAYQIQSGQKSWQFDKLLSQIAPGQAFKSIEILSPPFAFGKSLYVLVESDARFLLLKLNALSGHIESQLHLASAPAETRADLYHPSSACRLIEQNGVLICPSTAGVTVAVDLVTQTPLWAVRFRRDDVLPLSDLPPSRFPSMKPETWWNAWRETKTIIVGTNVVLCSPESDFLHVVDLRTGRIQKSIPRETGLYLAQVVENRAVIVGQSEVRAVDIQSGETLWHARVGMPAGRGYATGENYFLPLAEGTIVRIDMKTGTFSKCQSLKPMSLGNLVKVPSGVINQTISNLALLPDAEPYQRDILAQLQKQPKNQGLQLKRVAILRQSADFQAAANLLQTMYERQPDDESLKSMLFKTRLLQLEKTPQQASQLIPKIEPLLKSKEDRFQYLRVLAQAYAKSQSSKKSFESFLELLEIDRESDVASSSIPEHHVRTDRLIQGELIDFLDALPQDDLAPFKKILNERLREIVLANDPFALKKLCLQLGQLQIGQQARIHLAEQEGLGKEFLKTQLSLLELAGDRNQTLSGSAYKQLAELMNERSFRFDSANFYRILRNEFRELEFADMQTISEILAALPGDSLLLEEIQQGGKDDWPLEKPKITNNRQRNKDTKFQPVPIQVLPGGLLERLNVSIDEGGKTLQFSGCGQLGQWQLQLPATKSIFRGMTSLVQAWGLGHLLVVQAGSELFGVSPFDENGETNPKILWSVDTQAGRVPKFNRLGIRRFPARIGLEMSSFTMLDHFGRPIGQTGPIRPGYFCYFQFGKLIAAETVTANTLWSRSDLPPDSFCTGDDEFVIIYRRNSSKVEVLRALDGKTVAEYELSIPLNEALLLAGSKALTQTQQPAGSEIQLIDLATNSTVWNRTFAKGSQPFSINHKMFGVLEPDGNLRLLQLSTGDFFSSAQLDISQKVTGLFATTDERHLYVVVSEPLKNPAQVGVNLFLNNYRRPTVNGKLICFERRSGKLQWKTNLQDAVFPLIQPKEVPILILNYWQAKANGDNQNPEGILVILDKRSGAELYRTTGQKLGGRYVLHADADSGTINFKTQYQTISLQYQQ